MPSSYGRTQLHISIASAESDVYCWSFGFSVATWHNPCTWMGNNMTEL